MSDVADVLLREARVAHLATADRTGAPHVVPVCFVLHGGAIWTPLDRKPKKWADPRALRRVRNVLENPRVSLVVDVWHEDWSRLAYALVEGEATYVERMDVAVVEALDAKYPQYRWLPVADRPALRIAIARVVSWHA